MPLGMAAVYPRLRLGRPFTDRPRVTGADERLQVAVSLGVLELRRDELVVAVARYVTENPEGHGAVGCVRDARERERGRKIRLVVRDAGVAGRLAVPQVEPVLLLVPHEVERAVVVDVAVLEDLDERRASMRGCAAKHLRQTRLVGVDRARDERCIRPERD